MNHLPLRWLLAAFVYSLTALMLIGCDRGSPRPEFVRQTKWMDSGVWMKVDTHIHTTFSDGAHSVSVVAAKAREFGCDAIAITDHGDQNLKGASLEYAEAIEVARREHPELLILAGLEWNVPPWNGDTHATVLMPGGPDEFLHLADFKAKFDDFERTDRTEHLAEQAIRWLESIETADESRPVVILNHPSRKTESASEAGRQFQTMLDDSAVTIGFEGAPGHQKGKELGAYKGPVMLMDRWDPVAAEVGGVWDQQLGSGSDVWAALATSDFHQEGDDYWPGEFSETWVYARERTSAGVLSALRAGSFFSAHGQFVRDVSLTATTNGLSRPAAAGEVIQVAAGGLVDVRLTAQVPELDWAGEPNQIDAVELIVVTSEGARTIDVANASSLSDRLEIIERLSVPAGGFVVRARGRRTVADGPDLMFYTNPIRIEASSSNAELRPTLSRENDTGMLHACGLAGVLLLVPAVFLIWLIVQSRQGQGLWNSHSDGITPTFQFPVTLPDRVAWGTYLAVILLAILETCWTIGDAATGSSHVMAAAAMAMAGLLALLCVPVSPLMGLLVYALLSYSLERDHVVCRAIMDSSVMSWVTLLTVLGCIVRLIRQRQVPRCSAHPLLWVVLAFMAWTGVCVLAAVIASRPLYPDLVQRTDRLVQAFVMFLVAAHFMRSLPEFRLVAFVLGVMLVFRQRFFTTSTFLEQNLALLVAISIPLVFFVARTASSRSAQVFSSLVLAWLVRLVIVIQNRGAMLGLLASACVLWLFSPHRWKLLAVGVPLVIAVACFVVPAGVWHRFQGIYGDGAFQGSAGERLELWKGGLEIYGDYPVFGVGPGNYGQFIGVYIPHLFNMGAHNSFVDVMSETGAIGAGLYSLILLVTTWFSCQSAIRCSSDWRGSLHACFVAAIWAHFGTSFFLSANSLVLYFMILGMGISARTVPATAVAWPRLGLKERSTAISQIQSVIMRLPPFFSGWPIVQPAPVRRSAERVGGVHSVFFLFTAVFVSIAVLGSLAPFAFHPLSLEGAITRLTEHSVVRPDFSDLADWLSNICLFVPIGFFGLATATTGGAIARNSLWKAIQVLLLCTWLSASIEFVQLWFPARTVSLNDVLAETAGALCGGLLWMAFARRVTGGVCWIMSKFREPVRIKDWILCGYAVALVLYSIYPLDLTINPTELSAKFKSGRILLVPFQQGFDSVPATLVSLARSIPVAIPIGILAARLARLLAIKRIWPVTLLGGLGLVGLIGAIRLIVASQTFATTDLILRSVGVVLGILVVQRWPGEKTDGSTSRGQTRRHQTFAGQGAAPEAPAQEAPGSANSYPREIHDRVWSRNSEARSTDRGQPSTFESGTSASAASRHHLTDPRNLLRRSFRVIPVGLTILLSLLFANRYLRNRSFVETGETEPTSAKESPDGSTNSPSADRVRAGQAFDPLQTPTATEISVPDFPGSGAIWGATGADDRGHVWFGVSATDVATPSAHLFEYDPDSGGVTDRGSVVEELKACGRYRPGEGQRKIHSKIVSGGDGHLYFASMDEEGEKEDGSQLPTWGSHLWRLKLADNSWEHLAAVPEGLIAIDGLGPWIYSLGLFGHVLYQFDIQTEQLRSVRVGSAGGHISRNFVSDSRGHVFVPRVVESVDGEQAAAKSPRVRVTLVEFNAALEEIHETPLLHYLKYQDDHGITAFARMSGGSTLFLTSIGYLYQITPPQDGISDRAALVKPLGWFHPNGTTYSPSLFSITGDRYVAGLAKRPGKDWEWIVYDLESGRSTASPASFAPEQLKQRDDLLLYGSETRDQGGDLYIAGRYAQAGKPRPILVRLKPQSK